MSTEPTTAVTLDEVRHVADLASLELTAEELPAMARDLSAVLGYIAQLNELDVRNIEPMAQVAEALGQTTAAAGEQLRTDTLKPSLDRRAIMEQAPLTDGRFFKVPKVIER